MTRVGATQRQQTMPCENVGSLEFVENISIVKIFNQIKTKTRNKVMCELGHQNMSAPWKWSYLLLLAMAGIVTLSSTLPILSTYKEGLL